MGVEPNILCVIFFYSLTLIVIIIKNPLDMASTFFFLFCSPDPVDKVTLTPNSNGVPLFLQVDDKITCSANGYPAPDSYTWHCADVSIDGPEFWVCIRVMHEK